MAKRRTNGEGSIYRRKSDGLWVGALKFENERRRRTVYGRTQQAVKDKLTEARAENDRGATAITARLTAKDYLSGWILTIRPKLRASTWRRYREYIDLHAIPFLGHLPLKKVSALHIEQLNADRLEAGLSRTSVHHLNSVLGGAFEAAVRKGLIVRNPVRLAEGKPRIEKRDMAVLTPDELRRLLAAAEGDPLFDGLLTLAVYTGMRQGEMLALKWSDVDLEGANDQGPCVQVRATLRRAGRDFLFGEPKTEQSRRSVALAPAAVEALRRHRQRQLEERMAASYWQNPELVFTETAGIPVNATGAMRWNFQALLGKAGLPRIRFHDLRHSYATHALSQVPLKVVSECLGHATPAITLSVYAHVLPGQQRLAADAMEALLAASG
jgi:integrase